MANRFKFETRDERIARRIATCPGKSEEELIALCDVVWDKKRAALKAIIPDIFKDAAIGDLGYLTKPVLDSVEKMLLPVESDKNTVGIIFSGPAGSGKTHAAYAVLKWIASKNPDLIGYISSYPKIMRELREEFFSGSERSYRDNNSVWEKLMNETGDRDGVIFIDDVTATKQTDFELDRLLEIIDRRVTTNMPFILTTNIRRDAFWEVFGERLTSRFNGSCKVIDFEERDRRVNL